MRWDKNKFRKHLNNPKLTDFKKKSFISHKYVQSYNKSKFERGGF